MIPLYLHSRYPYSHISYNASAFIALVALRDPHLSPSLRKRAAYKAVEKLNYTLFIAALRALTRDNEIPYQTEYIYDTTAKDVIRTSLQDSQQVIYVLMHRRNMCVILSVDTSENESMRTLSVALLNIAKERRNYFIGSNQRGGANCN